MYITGAKSSTHCTYNGRSVYTMCRYTLYIHIVVYHVYIHIVVYHVYIHIVYTGLNPKHMCGNI